MKLKFLQILYTILLTASSSILIWLQLNLRFLNKWFEDNYLLHILITSPIIGFITYTYWGYAVKTFGSLWSAKLIAYSISTVLFAALSWKFLGESPFDTRTFICILLSFAILAIQIIR
tara:strand:- start:110 stop:463 length:354 start_codon:yes stop_codon:yes gene_type:complete